MDQESYIGFLVLVQLGRLYEFILKNMKVIIIS